MFTGIIQTKASVISTNLNGGVLRLVLSVGSEYLQHLNLGASIAISDLANSIYKNSNYCYVNMF